MPGIARRSLPERKLGFSTMDATMSAVDATGKA
jgi:hypothetical protein